LATRTGFRLLHDHLTVNRASAVFDRDSDVMLSEAARHGLDLIVIGVLSRSTRRPGTSAAPSGSFS
jgi:hypothetical protein